MSKKVLTHAEVARRGGIATKRLHGRKHYQQIAKKRWAKVKPKRATK